ncbi:MAG TPA: biotin--[acetyl-CoA-carboxylase] ligase [Chloroflexi bacterium]|nr:biotin--[acetyl-CoA-carboxylase] ligase [Chloroflexota bacterium]
MNQQILETQLQDLALGGLRYFESVGSTNDEAANWIKADCPDLALVITNEQNAGRGRGGRKWFSPAGSALAFSLVLRAEDQINLLLKYQNTARLNGLGALAVCGALQAKFGLPARIKWPNDVLIAGQKVAGVLAEAHWLGSELTAVVLGIGVNVSPASVPADDWDTLNPHPFPATCVETALGRPVDRWELLHALLAELLKWRKRLSEQAFLQAWEANLALREQWVQVIDPGMVSSTKTGRILALGEDGSLRLQSESGEVMDLRAGEIHPSDPPLGGFRLRPVDRPEK